MAWPKDAWKSVQNPGRKKKIESPEVLFGHFIDYMNDIDSNPWTKNDFRGKDVEEVTLEFRIPYTWNGFDNHLFKNGIIDNLDDYKYNYSKSYTEFEDVIKRIDKIIFDNKYTGSVINLFNANLISKELGFTEKREIVSTVTMLNLGSGVDPESPNQPDMPHEFKPELDADDNDDLM